MALCQGCAGHMYMGAGSSIPDDLAASANPLIGTAPGDTEAYVIPDWNSAAYLDRLQALVTAIAARYHDDPTFGWVDVFSYGNWGEFHLYPFIQPGGPYDHSTQRPITDDNARLIVKRAAAAFSNKLLVLNSENPAALTQGVNTVSPPIGLRVDCLGSDGLAGGADAIDAVPGANERWKTAPFITEWCQENLGDSGADLFVQGEQQVRKYHISMLSSGNFQSDPTSPAEVTAFRKANVEAGYRLRTASVKIELASNGTIHLTSKWNNNGVAPTYLHWNVVVGVDGPKKSEVGLNLDLRKILPGAAHSDTEEVTLLHQRSRPPENTVSTSESTTRRVSPFPCSSRWKVATPRARTSSARSPSPELMTSAPIDRNHPPRRIVHRGEAGTLVLRPWSLDDVDALVAAIEASRTELVAFLPWAHLPVSRAAQFEVLCLFIADYWAGRDLAMGIFSERGDVLGGVGLHPRIPLNPSALEVGYWGHSAGAGRGNVTRAVRMLVALAFDRFGCDRLQVMHDEANAASRRVIEKCGFAFEGTMRNITVAPTPALVAGGLRVTGRTRMYALCPEDLASLPWLADVRAGLEVFDAFGDRRA